ncbi:MAG TPA: NAD(P)/FAD-dependent oxidoreductase [Thermoflexia bacterium]|jgi:nitrite reductase (NADH) large subunit|nr:NAD(P)/FAD-dependent oxidoreductase [Thermoflexia bacterium]
MRYVIIGNGVAGITGAAELANRQAGTIEVYTEEPHPYYFRPQLPSFVAGEIDQERLYARPLSWYEERDIEVHLASPAKQLFPDQKRLLLADGTEVGYDRLLLATGSRPFIPPIAGVDKKGVFALRTLDDGLAIREYATRCREAVVIGGGLLGLEAARALHALGLSVTVLEFAPRLLPRQLDEEGAAIFRRLVEDLGLRVAVSAETTAILGDEAVRGVLLRDGREFPAQMVLLATGVRANTDLATEAGLKVDRGIVVDERMRTSAPDVYAAGDVASFNGRSWAIIPQARAQAQVAAANMAGEDAVYEEIVPSTTLKIVGMDLFSCGVVTPAEEGYTEIRVADPPAGIYRKIVLKDGLAVGAVVLKDRKLGRKLERLVVQRAALGPKEARALVEEGM